MVNPKAVIVHVGAHKTASTHLQKLCLANRDTLAAQGCAYFGPDRLRGDLRMPALERTPRAIARKIAPFHAALQAELAAGQRVLISNENILGAPRPPVLADGGVLYPRAALNIDALLTALDLRDVTLCLALRDPLDLLVSAWGHQHMAGRPMPFEAFCDGLDPMALRWSELVARLLGCAGVAQIWLWRYDAYRDHALGIVAHLAGLAEGAVLNNPPVASSSNYLTGPSARAIAALPKIMATHPDATAKDAMRKAMRRFPKSADLPGPLPFDAGQRAEGAACYAQDWAALQGWASVACLSP